MVLYYFKLQNISTKVYWYFFSILKCWERKDRRNGYIKRPRFVKCLFDHEEVKPLWVLALGYLTRIVNESNSEFTLFYSKMKKPTRNGYIAREYVLYWKPQGLNFVKLLTSFLFQKNVPDCITISGPQWLLQ